MPQKKHEVVYIASPYAGDIEKNLTFAKAAARFAIARGKAPYIPHLTLPAVLNDEDPRERALGIELNCETLSRCDALWVFRRNGISAGMAAEIAYAGKCGIETEYFDIDPTEGPVIASCCSDCMACQADYAIAERLKSQGQTASNEPAPSRVSNFFCCNPDCERNGQRIDHLEILRCDWFKPVNL